MKITIIGGGNGGQAMAGHFGYLGHQVTLYSRDMDKLDHIIKNKGVLLKEKINGFGKINVITDNLQKAIRGAELIMITSVANAHAELAEKMAPFLTEEQVVVLNPGRTFGALEFKNIISKRTNKKLYIAETQSLLYACRVENNGEVRIIGIKDRLTVAAIPSTDTDKVLSVLSEISQSFIKAINIFETSLDNIGCIFHPSVVLFNAAKIERGESFYFYNDMTPSVAKFIEALDKERLEIGKALGVDLLSATDWISYSYTGVEGETLCEKMQNNPAYYKIMAPKTLNSRLLTEDIPTGILPLSEIAKVLDIKTPLLDTVYIMATQILGLDFRAKGRTLKNLGLENIDIRKFIETI